MTRIETTIIGLILLFVPANARASVLAGTFDWSRNLSSVLESASFTYDTDTRIGWIYGLYPGPGYPWKFSLRIVDYYPTTDKVLASTFSDLTNFSTKDILVMPEISFGGPPVPVAVQGILVWNLYFGSAYGTLHEDWFTSDGALG